jgi:HK97 family phage prohead protease
MMDSVELREVSDGQLIMRGLASRTEVWYPIGGGAEEKICRSAFVRTINTIPPPDVALRIEHSNLPLARSTSKNGKPTLRLSETEAGLTFEATLNPRDGDVRDLQAKAEHTDLQCSFAFRCNRDQWNADMTRREILEVNMARGDIAVCCFGANEQTGLTVSERGALTLDERRAFAARLDGRVAGPQWGFRASNSCDRCGAAMDLRCSNCEPDGTYMAPPVSVATDGRSALDEFPSLDYYRKRAGLGTAVEQRLRRVVNEENKRKAAAELEHRKTMTDDWRAELEARAAARRSREQIYRGGR